MSNQIQLHERASYSYCARSWRQQTNPLRKKFPSGWKCYKTIGSYVSCAFIEIWSTWEVWRALKKLELLLAMPQATLMHLSCSPNFLRASYLDERMLMYEPIVNEWSCKAEPLIQIKLRIIFQIKLNPCFSPKINVRRLVFLSKFLYIKVVNYGIKWQFLLFFSFTLIL